jgi:hypothetical protein
VSVQLRPGGQGRDRTADLSLFRRREVRSETFVLVKLDELHQPWVFGARKKNGAADAGRMKSDIAE